MTAIEDSMFMLKDLAMEFAEVLSEYQYETVLSFADYAEPGVGLEMLCTALDDNDIRPTFDQIQKLANLTNSMGMTIVEITAWQSE